MQYALQVQEDGRGDWIAAGIQGPFEAVLGTITRRIQRLKRLTARFGPMHGLGDRWRLVPARDTPPTPGLAEEPLTGSRLIDAITDLVHAGHTLESHDGAFYLIPLSDVSAVSRETVPA